MRTDLNGVEYNVRSAGSQMSDREFNGSICQTRAKEVIVLVVPCVSLESMSVVDLCCESGITQLDLIH